MAAHSSSGGHGGGTDGSGRQVRSGGNRAQQMHRVTIAEAVGAVSLGGGTRAWLLVCSHGGWKGSIRQGMQAYQTSIPQG